MIRDVAARALGMVVITAAMMAMVVMVSIVSLLVVRGPGVLAKAPPAPVYNRIVRGFCA